MKQIPLKQAEALIKRIAKNNNNGQMKFLTKKKDRSLIIKTTKFTLELVEQGYVNKTTSYSNSSEAKRALQAAFKREFPRSHQVYISEEK